MNFHEHKKISKTSNYFLSICPKKNERSRTRKIKSLNIKINEFRKFLVCSNK